MNKRIAEFATWTGDMVILGWLLRQVAPKALAAICVALVLCNGFGCSRPAERKPRPSSRADRQGTERQKDPSVTTPAASSSSSGSSPSGKVPKEADANSKKAGGSGNSRADSSAGKTAAGGASGGLTPSGSSSTRGKSGGGASVPGPESGEAGGGNSSHLDAREALSKAKSSLKRAMEAAEKGDHQEAFVEALQGWSYIKDHAEESACKGVASELMDIMKTEGELVGHLPPSRKRFVIE